MMKWEKLGPIFNFQNSRFADEFVSHAQSPQALVFDDFVRIYFSTRKTSDNGKFVSHVRFVDFDKAMTRIVSESEHDVVGPGELGAFDEHGIFPFSPLRHQGKIFAYTTGWTRRVSVDVELGIGLVLSDDGGRTFRRLGAGPVLTASLNEPFLVCDGFVREYDGTLHMYYSYGTSWKRRNEAGDPERTYVIGHATSSDGLDWKREGRQVIRSESPHECQALPTVLKIGSRYHMYFCHRNTFDFRTDPRKSYRLGYAHTSHLDHWTRDDAAGGLDPSAQGWDSEMMCYPHLFSSGNDVFLLYNGNSFGRAGFGIARLLSAD